MPRLYVVPTPIGNLQDVTLRSLEVLRSVDLILAEDTRHSATLLRHFGIQTPLRSYHQHNKIARIESILRSLETQDIALVSNAGTPAIADPGFELIRAARDAGFEVDVLPGASALITAVVAAAVPAPGFLFAGFLPRRSAERRSRLRELNRLAYALVLYEAPHRLVATLRDMLTELGDRQMAVAREMTKLHQEVVHGTVSALLHQYEAQAPRGELTLVVAGFEPGSEDRGAEAADELRRRVASGQDARSAMTDVSREYGLTRNDAYRLWLSVSRGSQC